MLKTDKLNSSTEVLNETAEAKKFEESIEFSQKTYKNTSTSASENSINIEEEASVETENDDEEDVEPLTETITAGDTPIELNNLLFGQSPAKTIESLPTEVEATVTIATAGDTPIEIANLLSGQSVLHPVESLVAAVDSTVTIVTAGDLHNEIERGVVLRKDPLQDMPMLSEASLESDEIHDDSHETSTTKNLSEHSLNNETASANHPESILNHNG